MSIIYVQGTVLPKKGTHPWSSCVYFLILLTSEFPQVKTWRVHLQDNKQKPKSHLLKFIPLNLPASKEKLHPSPKCFLITSNFPPIPCVWTQHTQTGRQILKCTESSRRPRNFSMSLVWDTKKPPPISPLLNTHTQVAIWGRPGLSFTALSYETQTWP